MTDDSTTPEVLRLSPEALTTLAHPLRARLLGHLRRHGPGTATELAAALATNSGATSYHLRRLADVELVVDTGEGEGRRRVWRATTRGHAYRSSDFGGDERAEMALHWLGQHYLQVFTEDMQRWLEVADTWPTTWRDELGLNDDSVTVDPNRLAELHAELEAVVRRYRDATPGPDGRRVRVTLGFTPLEPEWGE